MIRNYVKLHSSIWTNPKFLRLSSDTARLAYIRCISAGNESEPNGEWIDRTYLAAAIGRKCAAFIPEMVEATLLVEDGEGVIGIRQWRLWQGRDRWSADELDAIDPDKAEARRKGDAERQKRKYHHDRGLHDLCPPTSDCRRGTHNLTQTSREPHGLLNERSSYRNLTREVPSKAGTVTGDASGEEGTLGTDDCFSCGRPVPGLAGNATTRLRDGSSPTWRIHGDCIPDIVERDGGLDPSLVWTDYDDKGYPIRNPDAA